MFKSTVMKKESFLYTETRISFPPYSFLESFELIFFFVSSLDMPSSNTL